jgi:formate hydrogenlyase subunit 4
VSLTPLPHLILVVVLPWLLAGTIRKVKALMQGRKGPPFLQPAFDLLKLMRKGETISSTASWVFRLNPMAGLVIAVLIAAVVPWTGASPAFQGTGAADLILVVYLLAAARFLSVLAALDTGSPFGGLGASRETTLSVVIEPGLLVSLGAVAIASGTTDLSVALESPLRGPVALLSGCAFLLASLAELSRMPVDDTTTHLELTMIHEATILENGGRNLGLIEASVTLRTALFLGIGVRILLGFFHPVLASPLLQMAVTVAAILASGVALGVLEGVTVKLRWRKVPSFVAFSTALAVMSALVAVVNP